MHAEYYDLIIAVPNIPPLHVGKRTRPRVKWLWGNFMREPNIIAKQ